MTETALKGAPVTCGGQGASSTGPEELCGAKWGELCQAVGRTAVPRSSQHPGQMTVKGRSQQPGNHRGEAEAGPERDSGAGTTVTRPEAQAGAVRAGVRFDRRLSQQGSGRRLPPLPTLSCPLVLVTLGVGTDYRQDSG